MNTKQTCCFTGHRPQKLPWGANEEHPRCQMVKQKTRAAIETAIQNGYTNFYCGMALGFDMICAEIVLELKKTYPYIKLIGAIPCQNQAEKWPAKQIERYNALCAQLDDSICLSETYTKTCMEERNQYMIDRSTLCIALYNGLGGGTKQTISKAQKKGLNIVIINP